MDTKELISRVTKAIIEGDVDGVKIATQECLDYGIEGLDIIELGGGQGLEIVGQKFEELEMFLPDLIASAQAMKALTSVVMPTLKAGAIKEAGKVVFGTVAGDLHDIGKNLTINQLSLNAFEVIDLGVDVKVQKFVEAAEAASADIIAMSALMSTSAYYQQELIEYLKKKGLREKYFVIVGGGPVTKEWAEKIGADGYGRTAVDCVKVCKSILGSNQKPGNSTMVIA